MFTVSEGHFPLRIATVATPSKEFMAEHSTRDMAEAPVNIWPVAPLNSDFVQLNGGRAGTCCRGVDETNAKVGPVCTVTAKHCGTG